MKRVGIITVVRTSNFGAELQAFSLQYKLNQLGYNAEIIDYPYFKNKRHKPTRKSKPELSFSFKESICCQLKYNIIAPVIDILFPVFNQKVQQKSKKFKTFHQKNIRFSKEFRTIESLYNEEHLYDVVISGSDQVWNPATFSSLKPYMLDFVSPNIKRVAYAASFGVSEVSEVYQNIYAPFFKRFDNIGVREESGKKLVERIAQREAQVVLDPTLLLCKEDWQCVINNLELDVKQPYILIYDLHPSEFLVEVVKYLQKKMNMPVYRLCKRAFSNHQTKNIINIEEAGPAEFVYLFMNASYVITNSFHGTVFSANFNIPFNVVLNPERENNSRITNFLKIIKLTERIIWENKIPGTIDITIIFNKTNSVIAQLRDKSISFINNAINS